MNWIIGADDVFTRLMWAGAIITAGLLLYRAVNSVLLARLRGRLLTHTQNNAGSGQEPNETGLASLIRGQPAILYFTTPECVACKTVQRPALQRLQECLGDRLRVIEVNAQEQPDLASRWGVLSVPTTFIIDGQGNPRHVNHGVTRAEKLFQQVEKIYSGGTKCL